MIKRWITYITALVLSAVFYAIYDGYLSFLILISVILLPGLSLLISLPHMLTTRAEFSSLPTEIYISNVFETSIKFETPFNFSLPRTDIKFFAHNITIDHDSSNQTISVNGCNGKVVQFPLSADHVGCIYINILSIRVFDYLGMFYRPIKAPQPRKVFVMPHPVRPKPYPVFPYDITQGKGFRPKPGGGFAENYDLREYRIGDPLNSIHWKLSSKLDELIVREPLVSDKGKLFICINLFGTPDEIDSTFSQLDYIARLLLSKMNEFYICYYDSDEKMVMSLINEENDYRQFLTDILAQKINRSGKPVDKEMWKQSDWFYIVRPSLHEDENSAEEESA